MDYIAEFKYPEIVDTLFIPRHLICNTDINKVLGFIVNWLRDTQISVNYKPIIDTIKKIDIITGSDCSVDVANVFTNVYLKVVIQLIKGELLIKIVDTRDNRGLTYKRR